MLPNPENSFLSIDLSIDTVIVVSRDIGSRREVIRVGKRVHMLLATGKGISVRL